MRLALAASAAAVAALALAAPALPGVGGPAFYFQGTLYRTVGTPTDLSGTNAPAHSYDVIYQFFGAQPYNVTTVAPGSPGYNGGRWMVVGLTFADYGAAVAEHDANASGDFDSAAEVQAAIGDGDASAFDTGVRFVCPVIQLPRGG